MGESVFHDWLTLAEAASRYEVKRDRLRRATLEGRLPAHKVGTGTRMPWLVRAEDVERYVRESHRGRKRLTDHRDGSGYQVHRSAGDCPDDLGAE